MNRSIKISSAPMARRILAYLFDLISVLIASVVLYFSCLYAISIPASNYKSNASYVAQINEKYTLDLPKGLPYQQYEKAVYDFYLVEFPTEIEKLSKDKYSIEYIYNTKVLDLPLNPTAEKHSNDYFTYLSDADGKVNPDKVGMKKSGLSGDMYERNMYDLFHYKHSQLIDIMRDIDTKYADAMDENLHIEMYTRLGSVLLSIIIFYIILPFCFKNGSTLFEKIYGFGHVNFKNGYQVQWYKILLRPVVYFIIPVFFTFFVTDIKTVLLAIFPLFASFLLMVFQKDNKDLADWILSMTTVELADSVIFKNMKEEKDYEESDDYKEIKDQDYLDKLESIDKFNLSESRDEELKK